MSNTSDKLLASLCYFSVFFAPILMPIIVWIIAKKPVSEHAKKSLIYHIFPWVLVTIACIFFSLSQHQSPMTVYFIVAILALLAALYYLIYNLYCGIKVLVS